MVTIYPDRGGISPAGTPTFASLSVVPTSASAAMATLSVPSGSSLVSWVPQYRVSGEEDWESAATETDTVATITGLDPETEYEFQGIAVVTTTSTTTNVVAVATAEKPPVPLVQWAQVEGGMQFGGAFEGGAIWWWNDPAQDGTFFATITNQESDPIVAAQVIVEGAGASVAPMVGWGIQSGGAWDTDATEYQPAPGGSVASPKIAESAELALTNPIAGGGSVLFQEVRAPGTIVPATSLSGSCFPSSGIVAGENFLIGNHLGANPDGGFPGLGPMASRVYFKKSGAPLYVFGTNGDSTTVPVQPLDSATPLSREGYHFRANQALRAAGKRVRIYSYGQGAAGWSDILARGRAILPHVRLKLSRLATQVFTWNSAWLTVEQAEAAWLEYLVFEAEVISAGIGSSPMILNPYTTRNDPGQIAAFGYLKAQVQAHPYGIVLDEIMGGAAWPDLPASESEDNVHQNGVGAVRTGPLAADVFLSVAAADYPELA